MVLAPGGTANPIVTVLEPDIVTSASTTVLVAISLREVIMSTLPNP